MIPRAYNTYPVPVTDALAGKTKELQSQFDEIKGSTTLISVIVSVLILTMLGLLVMTSPILDWLGLPDSEIGSGFGVVVLIFAVIAGILIPVIYISTWMDRYWKRHYRQAWGWLEYTDLPQLVVDDGRWEQIFTAIESLPFPRLIKVQRPTCLDEQIELASDFRLALIVLTRGAADNDIALLQRRLIKAVWWGRLTRFLERIVQAVFNSCLLWGCLIFGGALWYTAGLPFWLPLLGLYMRRQAWQTAMVDHFIGKPSLRVSGVTLPAVMKKK